MRFWAEISRWLKWRRAFYRQFRLSRPPGAAETPAAASDPAATAVAAFSRTALTDVHISRSWSASSLHSKLSFSLQEQQQAFYQLMQQQDLQIPSMPLSSAQLPINNLLPGSQSKGQGAITANPFLALQHTHADTHAASGAQKPRLAEKAVGVAGQEKTWQQRLSCFWFVFVFSLLLLFLWINMQRFLLGRVAKLYSPAAREFCFPGTFFLSVVWQVIAVPCIHQVTFRSFRYFFSTFLSLVLLQGFISFNITVSNLASVKKSNQMSSLRQALHFLSWLFFFFPSTCIPLTVISLLSHSLRGPQH